MILEPQSRSAQSESLPLGEGHFVTLPKLPLENGRMMGSEVVPRVDASLTVDSFLRGGEPGLLTAS